MAIFAPGVLVVEYDRSIRKTIRIPETKLVKKARSRNTEVQPNKESDIRLSDIPDVNNTLLSRVL